MDLNSLTTSGFVWGILIAEDLAHPIKTSEGKAAKATWNKNPIFGLKKWSLNIHLDDLLPAPRSGV
jgi:hypothetical protein